MTDEVLIVDDQEAAAARLAEFMRVATGLGVVHTSDPVEAVDLVRSLPIKVAVLDQRMPERTGIQLSVDLRSINEHLRVIMFTGKASPDEVAEATLRKNFNDVLQKGSVSRLGEAIFEQYVAYSIEVAKRIQAPLGELYRTPRQYRLFGPRVIYSLLDLRVMCEEYVDGGQWQTVIHLTRGQEEKRSSSWTTKFTVTIEQQSQEMLRASVTGRLRDPVGYVQAALERTVSDLRKDVVAVERTAMQTRELTYKLSDQDAEVRSRHIQRAPVYRQWLARLRVECDRCGSPREERVVLEERLPIFATRHIDSRADGSTVTYETGTVGADYI
ncbi:response regulator [Micromonospora echinofusca]|uniref:response regulator n=1 Tax=Micromonospora echinofusca TaxID=47858 RepID=UPI0033F917F8